MNHRRWQALQSRIKELPYHQRCQAQRKYVNAYEVVNEDPTIESFAFGNLFAQVILLEQEGKDGLRPPERREKS